jgi:hypothetical protein
MTLSGSSVTQWNDKSVNGANGTAVGTTPTIASGGGITFSAGAYNTSYSSSLTNESLFVVFRYTKTSGTLSLLGQTGDGGRLLAIGGGASTGRLESSVYNVAFGSVSLNTTVPINTIGLGELITTNSSMVVFYNGTSVGTPTAVTITAGRTSIIGGASNAGSINTGQYFEGIIYEVIGFTNALTTSQRQQVEGYLAHKWGLVGPSPTTPLTIPGCQLWLDGADPAGTGTPPADGATVSTWVDKSGNGYNATAAPSRTAGTYSTSFRAVNFPNSTTGYITNYSAAPTNETMFVVFNNPSPSGNNNIIIGGVSGARSLGAGFTAAGTGTVGNLNTQIVWLASTGTYTAGTTVFTTSQFTPSSNSISLNGGTFSTGGAPGFTAGRVTYLGVDATNPVYYYIGYAMEILFYNSILTTTQRQTIETYLTKKWSIGSSSIIPSTHPFYSIRPHLRVFRPTDIPGCTVWLDGADQSSMTLSGSNITQWRDKSGTGNNYTNNGTVTYTNNSVYFNGSSDMRNTSPLNFSIGTNPSMSTFMVFSYVNGTVVRGLFQYGLVTCSKTGYVLYIEADKVYATLYCLALNVNNTVPANVTTIVSDVVTYTGTPGSLTRSGWVNGAPMSVTNASITDVNLNLNSISTIGNTAYGDPFLGYISEVIYYNQSLTTSQRQQIEGYLAHKWGLIASFTNPLSIPGCALWLDAADATTITGTTTVTQWRDKSGNARHLGVGSGNTSYSSNAIQLANSYMLVTTPVDLTKVTVFIVVRTAGGSNKTVFTGRPQTSLNWNNLDGFGFYMDNQDGVRFYGQEQSGQFSTFTVNTSTPQVFSFQSIGTSVSGWYNGIPQSGGTLTSPRTSTAQGFAIGGEWYDGAYGNVTVNASIYEIIVYNSDVSTLQRQAVESYLAKKWSIGSTSSSLASTHPFSIFPPASVFLSFSLVTDNLIVSLDPITYVAASTSWQTVGNTWTLTSPATIVSTGGGVALSLTSQQSITDTTGISTGPASTNNFTIELWFNAPGNSTNNLISEVNGGWNTTMMYLENNTIRAGFWNGGAYSFSMGTYSANTWTQACYTYSGTTVRCYVNGVFVSTDSTTKQYPGVANYRLATTGWPVLSNTAIIIGGFRIYSTALSAADVKQNYNAYASRFGLNTL